GIFVALALLAARAAQVQVGQGSRWAEEAQAKRTERIVLAARRGALLDRHGMPLGLTQETYHVGIAPNELRDPPADGALIARRLGLTARAWQQAVHKRYAYFAGPYSGLEVQPLRSVRGVHLEAVLNRFYPAPDLARAAIGRLGDDGHGASGLEKTLDTLLAGRAGAAVVLKDREGREYESPARVIAAPVPGLDVVLTLDADLQEIGQRAPGRHEDPPPPRTRTGGLRPATSIAATKSVGPLAPPQQSLTVRALGFAASTRIECPAEAPGRPLLRTKGTRHSPASLAMG